MNLRPEKSNDNIVVKTTYIFSSPLYDAEERQGFIMQEIFTLSAYETDAGHFFEALKEHHTDLLLDVRLKNTNQLCGFTRKKDLEYLVPLVTGARYEHDVRFAPSPETLKGYLNHWTDWEQYRKAYLADIGKSDAEKLFRKEYGRYRCVCLLGTATKKRRSHSEALAELLAKRKEG